MIISLLLLAVFCTAVFCDLQNITDISKCKLSHLGLDFTGQISRTEGGVLCQSWTAKTPLHKVDESINDEMFPERSMANAKNHCRNPKGKEDGPWCYSMDVELIDDTCGIPLCSFTECRVTGPGMEYGGAHNRASSGKKCLKWDKRRKKVWDVHGNEFREQEKFSKRRFPDETRGDAKKYCRNPDGDPGGPWCFVDNSDKKGVRKEYCDIPFCDSEDCTTFTRNLDNFTHYTSFNNTFTNLTFGLKLWSPDDHQEASARILLSLFALPLTGDEIHEQRSGIEIYISNKESALTVGNKDKPDFETTTNFLKSSTYTYFSLMWSSGFVTLNLQDVTKPIFLAEYKSKKGLFGENRDQFFYYSIQGTNMLWSFPLCEEEEVCEVHATTTDNFERFWPLHRTNSSHDVRFFIRGFHSACILFQPTPLTKWPSVKLMFARNADNVTKIVLYEYDGAPDAEMKSVTILKLLNFWEWHQFTVSFFAETMQIFWDRDIGSQLIAEVNHAALSGMRWFSPGSADSLTLWTFFCSAGPTFTPPPPWPPECVLHTDEIDYGGTQAVTSLGHPCLPWTSDSDTKSNLGKEETLKLWNYCRDPFGEKTGTFCHVVAQTPERGFVKEKCHIRLCRSAECRMAGTGNDYIGKLNRTRSNRTCQHWTTNSPHQVDPEFLNGSLFADQDPAVAENFCRDPSRNIAGPWCYTTDVNVSKDLCDVRDCSKREECIVMTRGNGEGRYIYILPEWKEAGMGGGLHFALKEWNPDLLDGIIFELMPLDDAPGYLKIIIGADDNERVVVYYSSTNRESAEMVKEKTLLHLIPAGKWAAFWLQMRRGEIMLGYEGNSEPLFTWEHDDKSSAFEPGLMTYMSIQGNIIGVYFKCTECHTERTNTHYLTRIMPIGLWSSTENAVYGNLSIYARGTGILLVPLLLLPRSGDYYGVAIGDEGTHILFVLDTATQTKTLKGIKLQDNVLQTKEWTHYFLSFTEHNIEIFRNNQSVIKYESPTPLLFYWFSIGVEKGWVEWAANCDPPDIDGAPRDGGWSQWSPWTCTVSCGGGDGFRTRTCSNPKPNIRGHLCEGPYKSTGRCNEFECGDLSPETLDKIREQLRSRATSVFVDEGDRFTVENNKEMLDLIRNESPKAYYKWTLNGVFLMSTPGKVDFTDDNVVILHADSSYSGVYVCIIYRIGGERFVLSVSTVAVRSKHPDVTTRATLGITLVSNAAVLGYVYIDVSQAWLLNDTVILDYGTTTLAAYVTERIEPVNLSHSGIWTCRIQQVDLGLEWITNLVQVQIKTEPTWLTHLMEDQFTAPIFGWIGNENGVFVFLIVIVVLVVLLVFIGLVLYLKYGTLPKRQYRRKLAQ